MLNLQELAKLVRYYILMMTTEANSGHPTTALSATDIMVALFFAKMTKDDRVIFSKGHASPLIYALYAVAGLISEDELKTYRRFGSVLEGHPTHRFKFAQVATGSLGQGLSIGLGEALVTDGNVYVLMGDGETAEGSIWEACELASFHKVGNLVGIVDVNRLGQSRETMLGWDTDVYKARFEAFGWQVHVVDGHDMEVIVEMLDRLPKGSGMPQMILAKTKKGKGISFLEDKEGWHGKALSKGDFEKAVKELGNVDKQSFSSNKKLRRKIAISHSPLAVSKKTKSENLKTNYQLGEEVATRKAYGEALVQLAQQNEDIMALDGETSNSTFSELVREKTPDQYLELFIAEQNMAGVALGLSKVGKIPFASTFAAFWTRAHDQVRMSAYSQANVKFVGSHAGVSIGEDGPSQMGLEDIAQFRSVLDSVVLCPADAVSCAKLVVEAANHNGIVYLRTARPATPVIYKNEETFKIGGSKVIRQSAQDKLTIVACGVCVPEALKAADELEGDGVRVRVVDAYSIKPIDVKTLKTAAKEAGNIVVSVEDHYFDGGLGDAVLNVFAEDEKVKIYKLAVSYEPMSGKSAELLEFEGIDAKGIVSKVKSILG